jgi:outer membrane protein assembly factor BamD
MARAMAIACCVLILGACSSRDRAAEQLLPEKLYERGNKAMLNGDFRGAVRYYEALEARYPFSELARQARLDIIYSYYKAREAESAVDAADQFIRENPTHPRVDYAMYIKGLVYFERSPNFLERWFNTELTERPPSDARRSFQSFQSMIERFPQSEYAHDARQRMIFLRNRLAEYEVHVADYYLGREAWVAAIARARYCIENYDGAPAVRDALGVMIAAYEGLGMADLAERSQEINRLQVLAPAVAVAHEIRAARIVEIKHRGHRIDPQPVDMKFPQPVECIRDQERPDLLALIIEYQRAPIAMLGFPVVVILVKTGAVEACQPVGVARKVCRNPVEDHAKVFAMEMIDHPTELVRRPEAAGR